jgi:hypothetical protein
MGLDALAFRPQHRLGRAANELVRGNHLGNRESGSEAAGDPPERRVSDTGQGRQDSPAVEEQAANAEFIA